MVSGLWPYFLAVVCACGGRDGGLSLMTVPGGDSEAFSSTYYSSSLAGGEGGTRILVHVNGFDSRRDTKYSVRSETREAVTMPGAVNVDSKQVSGVDCRRRGDGRRYYEIKFGGM